MTNEADLWYRVEVHSRAIWDFGYTGDDPYVTGYRQEVEVQYFAVLKTTPKGVWVRQLFGKHEGPTVSTDFTKHFTGDRFFIRGTASKQLCVPTLDLAYKDAIARKSKHVSGCKARLYRAEREMAQLTKSYQRHTVEASTGAPHADTLEEHL